jgi:N6-L-threonylcarbamoyladenine synthase
MIVLGIETSCDETAASVVTDDRRILSNVTLTQIKQHEPYGGVVPEIAARAHLDFIEDVVTEAVKKAGISLQEIDAIAATAGPGLIGGVLVGVMMGKALAASLGIPFIPINHLEGHSLTIRLTDEVPFPYLLLLTSGGHCQFLEVIDVGHYRYLGGTIDDAAGEAFDKTAKLLNLPYPGGPQIEKLAQEGDPEAYDFPRPLKGRPGCDFSFAGLKTAVRTMVQRHECLSNEEKSHIAAGFQEAIADCMVDRTLQAIKMVSHPVETFVIAGGVAANGRIRAKLASVCAQEGLTLMAPPLNLCTDNAAMIAWVGIEKLKKGEKGDFSFAPRPRWPLGERMQ